MTTQERRLAELNGTLDLDYAQHVHMLLRKKYSQSAVEAIINNYLSNQDDEQYHSEFLALQEYRAECKAKAKAEIYGE